MRSVVIMAVAEVKEGLRNRWILTALIGLTLFAFSLALLGSAPMGEVKVSALNITSVSLSSLSVYLIPLIALMLAFDAIVGESERGTLLLLLSYPIKRWQVLLGKFLGHIAILSLVVIVGYGLAGLYISQVHETGSSEWKDFSSMIASTILLGCVFLSIGYLLSVIVSERATAIGAAIAIWLTMIVAFDFILLGLVLLDEQQIIDSNILAGLILLNPTDIYRLFNLAGNEGAALISGMNISEGNEFITTGTMLGALVVWVSVPFIAATTIFNRREV